MDMPLTSNSIDKAIQVAFRNSRTLIDTDPENAKVRLSELAEIGCTEAMVCLGVMYTDGDENEREKAEGLFRRAAEMGDHSGMRNLAYIYAIGINVDMNKQLAAEWYERSARLGNPKAQCNLGVMYEFGNGVPQDYAEAAKWYSMSAVNGYFRGQTNLGVLALEGKGIGRDPVLAAHLFSEAKSPRAYFQLAIQHIEGNGVETDMKKAVELLEDSHARGYAKASALLAKLTEDSDREHAVELYTHAASKGNQDAIDWLASKGIDIPERVPRKKKRRIIPINKG